MDIEEIQKALINHLAAVLSVEVSGIEASSSLQSLGMASMGMVEIFIFIEQKFGLELMSAGLGREDLETVRSLAEAVARNLPNEE